MFYTFLATEFDFIGVFLQHILTVLFMKFCCRLSVTEFDVIGPFEDPKINLKKGHSVQTKCRFRGKLLFYHRFFIF